MEISRDNININTRNYWNRTLRYDYKPRNISLFGKVFELKMQISVPSKRRWNLKFDPSVDEFITKVNQDEHKVKDNFNKLVECISSVERNIIEAIKEYKKKGGGKIDNILETLEKSDIFSNDFLSNDFFKVGNNTAEEITLKMKISAFCLLFTELKEKMDLDNTQFFVDDEQIKCIKSGFIEKIKKQKEKVDLKDLTTNIQGKLKKSIKKNLDNNVEIVTEPEKSSKELKKHEREIKMDLKAINSIANHNKQTHCFKISAKNNNSKWPCAAYYDKDNPVELQTGFLKVPFTEAYIVCTDKNLNSQTRAWNVYAKLNGKFELFRTYMVSDSDISKRFNVEMIETTKMQSIIDSSEKKYNGLSNNKKI